MQDPDRRDRADAHGSAVVAPTPEKRTLEGPRKPLTDEDMPPLEMLDAESDYSGFLSPGVSDALRRMALRKLFSTEKFQIRDGLDDYDRDYNLLLPLRSVLAEATQEELTQQLQRRADEKLQALEVRHVAGDDERPPNIPEEDVTKADVPRADVPRADVSETSVSGASAPPQEIVAAGAPASDERATDDQGAEQ